MVYFAIIILTIFPITSFADSNTFLNGSPLSPDILIAIPTITENTKSAIILSFESNFEKSLTVTKSTVLSAIDNSSVVSSSTTSSSDEIILTFQEKYFHAPFIIRNPLPGDKVIFSEKKISVQDMMKSEPYKEKSCIAVIEEIGNPFVSIIVLS